MLQHLENTIDKNNINLINGMFSIFTATMILSCCLFNLFELRLPIIVRQIFCYGKHSYKGCDNSLIKRAEVPKSWFKHFYIFAFVWVWFALILILRGLLLHTIAPEWLLTLLDLLAGGRYHRRVEVSATCGFVATFLMTMQCTRRFYETNFLQVFSKQSKINCTQYLVGYLHYFGAIIGILSNMEGFVRDSAPISISFTKLSLLQHLCVFIFYYSWTQQYRANVILVELRQDRQTGRIITEEHLMPSGDHFEIISSPHMWFEIVMYLALLGLLWNSTTWYYVCSWVVSNQIFNALQTHKWYKENFKHYPKTRYAIIPYVL